MKYVKIYDAYSTEDYQKALKSVKSMIQSGKSKDDMLAFINKYYSDSAKKIDDLRVMLDRIEKKYSQFSHYHFYNRKTVVIKKRGGGYENKNTYDSKRYYCFVDKGYKKILVEFISIQKKIYNDIIDSVEDIDTSTIKLIFDRLFEVLDWVNNTGDEKNRIKNNKFLTNPPKSDEDILHEFEAINDMDFENEVEEVTNLIRIGKIQIKKAINS